MSQNTLRWLFAGCKIGSVAALGVAACSLLGHLMDIPKMYTWGSAGVMSIPTATYASLLSTVSFGLSYGMRELEKQTRQGKTPARKKLA